VLSGGDGDKRKTASPHSKQTVTAPACSANAEPYQGRSKRVTETKETREFKLTRYRKSSFISVNPPITLSYRTFAATLFW
jgi:hypothetical protein